MPLHPFVLIESPTRTSSGDEFFGEVSSFFGEIEHRDAFDLLQAFLRGFAIACAGLALDERGAKEVEVGALLALPLSRGLLFGLRDEVAAGASREEADDGGFDVDFRFWHVRKLHCERHLAKWSDITTELS